MIASSAYHGPQKGFTFSNYVTLHQAAHNELLDLDEPVAETKKVSDFLKGIRDPTLVTAKSVVLGDPAKLDDFLIRPRQSVMLHLLGLKAAVVAALWLIESRVAPTLTSNFVL